MKLQICIADYWYDELVNVLSEKRENWDGYPINVKYLKRDSYEPGNNTIWIEVEISTNEDAQYLFLAALRVGWNLKKDMPLHLSSFHNNSLN